MCSAQAPIPDNIPYQAPAAQTTLVISSKRPMPDGLWPALVAALREELGSDSPETSVLIGETTGSATGPAGHASGKDMGHQVQIVRGDMIGHDGLIVEESITIYLHGECEITPRPRSIVLRDTVELAPGALGWVQSDHGHIGPFAHVECSHLGKILANQAFGLNRDGCNQLMAVAIARVILHEWIHIATQNPHHSEHGLAKAQFGVADLLARPI